MSKQDIVIQTASKETLQQVTDIEQLIYGTEGYSKYFIRQAYDCWENTFYIAKNQPKVAGYALLTPSTKSLSDLWVLSVAVAPIEQGKGVAKKLMQFAINNRGNYERLLLTVSPNNKVAYKLYTSLGFTLIDQELDYYGEGEARDVLALSFSKHDTN